MLWLKKNAALSGAWLAMVLLAGWPVITGINMLRRPALIRAAEYAGRVPTAGPYIDEEIKQAGVSLMRHGIVPDEISGGWSRKQVETAAEGERKLERARKIIWGNQREKNIREAEARRPAGAVVAGLGVVLMLAFGWTGWRLWREKPDPLL